MIVALADIVLTQDASLEKVGSVKNGVECGASGRCTFLEFDSKMFTFGRSFGKSIPRHWATHFGSERVKFSGRQVKSLSSLFAELFVSTPVTSHPTLSLF